MGSFNTTCFASYQTIASGDKCYIIPIVASLGYNPVEISLGDKKYSKFGVTESTCYASAFWKPIGRPIAAAYDDYGQVIIDPAQDNLLILSNFLEENKKKFYKAEQGKNEYHEQAFDPEKLDPVDPIKSLDYMWRTLQSFRIFFNHYHGEPVQFSFAIIAKDSADYLVKYVEKAKNWENQSLKIGSVATRFKNNCNDILKDIDSLKRSGVLMIERELNNYLDRGESYNVVIHEKWDIINNILENKTVGTNDLKSFKQFLREKYIFNGLDCFNIKIQPMFYASQDYDNSVGKAYAKFVSEVSVVMCKNRDERYN